MVRFGTLAQPRNLLLRHPLDRQVHQMCSISAPE
jgi:hypothetical protein